MTTPNSTQMNTSRQCMLKLIHVTTDWHLSHRFMVHTKSFIFVSNVVTLVSVDLYQHQRPSRFVFDFPKLNLCQHVFTLNFFICACEYILFLQSTYMWINTIFSHADIAGSFRVSLVVGVHSIWAHGGGESFFGTFMISWPNFLYCDWLENRIKNRPVTSWFGLSKESCVKMSKCQNDVKLWKRCKMSKK